MSYSCNDNQNYFVSETGRTTSRVLNPPGGASSFSLGSDVPTTATAARGAAPPPSEPKAQPAAGPPSVAMMEGAVKEATNPAGASGPPSELVAPAISASAAAAPTPTPVSANAFASGANMNGANVMTGRPTSRVLAPPGGHSALGGSLW